VFSSEDYGDKFSELMGAKHVSVDRDRSAFPVSGTAVREDSYANWEFLEPCVRVHFVKRVVIVGAESTGKTILAQVIAKDLNTVWVAEYGREYCEIKFSGHDPISFKLETLPPWRSEEFEHIAERQLEREDQACLTANKHLICDTNALATLVWQERYVGCQSKRMLALANSSKPHLYLILSPDVPFVQDGTRDGEHKRTWMHNRFIEVVQGTSVPFLVLEGSYEDRTRNAVTTVRSMIESR